MGEKNFSFEGDLNLRRAVEHAVDWQQNLGIPKADLQPIPKVERLLGVEALWHPVTELLVVKRTGPGKMTMKDLALMTVPVVDFIADRQPDIIVGCDRGARIYALAVQSMWQQLNPGKAFPTLDGKLHFARLSTSLPLKVTAGALDSIIQASFTQAKALGKSFNEEKISIMFIDDLINSGATRKQIMTSLNLLGIRTEIDTFFAVMFGEGADATGNVRRFDIPWHDKPELIGVNYDGKGRSYPVRSPAAMELRQTVYTEVKRLAGKLQR